MKRIELILCLLLGLVATARADEGMWMIQHINAALEKKMQERGLALSAGEIYNADAPGASVSDAIVSIGFYCTGGIVSDEGLLITNHHCAYGDLFSLGTPDRNYLEEGFWAFRRDEEIPVPGKRVYFLKRVLDVTGEVNELAEEQKAIGRPAGMRRLSYLMERRYAERTGLEASLHAMWSGEKYYLALYEVFTDIRLVAAPPVSTAAFGGDIDNWEWPQHKCDFTLYRVYAAPDGSPAPYAAENRPLRGRRKLTVSTAGLRSGDFTMVIGYPARTDRYAPSAKVRYLQETELPLINGIRARQMAVIKGWMNADPAVRAKYADLFFSLSNVQEMQEGEETCLRRFGVVREKAEQEERLRRWIAADPIRQVRWGTLLEDLDSAYSATAPVERAKACYRECIFRGLTLTRHYMRIRSTWEGVEERRRHLLEGLAQTDPRVERDLLQVCLEAYYAEVDSLWLGPYQRELAARFGRDYAAMADTLWASSVFSQPGKAGAFTGDLSGDGLYRFIVDVDMARFNGRPVRFRGEMLPELTVHNRLLENQHAYEQAMYRMREEAGELQYPDANSTMRLSYGTVGDLEPRDGIHTAWYSTARGLLEKHDPDDHDFCLDPRMHTLVSQGDWGPWAPSGPGKRERFRQRLTEPLVINFLTDNDISGGNSGSPVLNARGELVGLAFDGNKESLAGDCSYTPGYNRCVCVDIRYVLWWLDRYARLPQLLREMGVSSP